MELETYLNAMQYTQTQAINLAMLERLDPYYTDMVLLGRRERQHQAFRARILKMDAQQREDIRELGTALDMVIADLEEQCNELDKKDAEIKQKDATIERLRRNNQTFANASVRRYD